MITIYAIFNKDGVPLYVGSTCNYKRRRRQHLYNSCGFMKSKGERGDYIKVIDRVVVSERWEVEKHYHELFSKDNLLFKGEKSGSSISRSTIDKIASKQRGVPKNKDSIAKMSITRRKQCDSGVHRDRLALLNKSRMKGVIDNNGVYYESVRECSRITGVARCEISGQIKGKINRKSKGYTFRRV